MTRALIDNHKSFLAQSKATYPGVTEIDVVVGITYGTDKTTNNKENQILIKLLDHGFEEEDRVNAPGILIDSATRSIRVYRRIGKDFWSFIGNPQSPNDADFVFLEVLLALAYPSDEAHRNGAKPPIALIAPSNCLAKEYPDRHLCSWQAA